jgi:hypothetical protein
MKSKKFSVLWGTLVIAGVGMAFGLVLAGCASSGGAKESAAAATVDTAATTIDTVEVPDEPKSIVLTGFDLEDKTQLLVYQVSSVFQMDLDNDSTVVYGNTRTLYDGDIAIERFQYINNERIPWTGIGKYYIYLQVYPANNGKGRSAYFYSTDGINPAHVDIKDEVTPLEWSKFVYL